MEKTEYVALNDFDALLLATAEHYGVGVLVSLNSDFSDACKQESILQISFPEKLEVQP